MKEEFFLFCINDSGTSKITNLICKKKIDLKVNLSFNNFLLKKNSLRWISRCQIIRIQI